MNPRPIRSLAALSPLALLAACGHQPAGEVVIVTAPAPPPGPPVVYEIEPNDDAWSAMPLGPLGAGAWFAIEGHVDDCCFDLFDGFSFYATEPLEISVRLYADDPWADLDIGVYDPLEDAFVASFDSTSNPEVGVFALGLPTELHLVVSSWSGSSGYRLEVETWPLSGAHAAEAAPARLSVASAPDAARRQRFAPYRTPPAPAPDRERMLQRELRAALEARAR